MAKEYKSVYYKENKISSFLSSGKPTVHTHMTQFMNSHAQGGWKFISMGKWKKDLYVMIFERDV
jgi:hypothetical protein